MNTKEEFSHVSPQYCDYNSTTPLPKTLIKRAEEAYRDYWANPSSPHSEGEKSKKLINKLKKALSRLPLSQPYTATLCGSATEANNIALNSLQNKNTIFASPLEHASLHKSLKHLNQKGKVHFLELENGSLKADQDLSDADALVCQAANNETGAIHPIQVLRASLPKHARILLDLSQGLGKLPNWRELIDLADYVIISPHKFYGPKGIGILLSKPGAPLIPLMRGGGQEGGIRPGTENMPLLKLTFEWLHLIPALQKAQREVTKIRNEFEKIIETTTSARALKPNKRLGNTTALHLPKIDADALTVALDADGWRIATGSACHSGALEPSHVFRQSGLTWDEARQTIRVSFGLANPPNTAHTLAQTVTRAITRIQSVTGVEIGLGAEQTKAGDNLSA